MTTNAHDDNAARMFRSGHYNAYDGKGWQKCAEGLPVGESATRDKEALWRECVRRADADPFGEPRFVVGQTISTLEEYEALPVGTVLITSAWNLDSEYRKDEDGFALVSLCGRPPDREDPLSDISTMVGVPRTIRSLPLSANPCRLNRPGM